MWYVCVCVCVREAVEYSSGNARVSVVKQQFQNRITQRLLQCRRLEIFIQKQKKKFVLLLNRYRVTRRIKEVRSRHTTENILKESAAYFGIRNT